MRECGINGYLSSLHVWILQTGKGTNTNFVLGCSCVLIWGRNDVLVTFNCQCTQLSIRRFPIYLIQFTCLLLFIVIVYKWVNGHMCHLVGYYGLLSLGSFLLWSILCDTAGYTSHHHTDQSTDWNLWIFVLLNVKLRSQFSQLIILVYFNVYAI